MMRRVVITVLLVVLAWPGIGAAATCGVVFMHGKWGGPSKYITNVVFQLHQAGCVVEAPDLPWSGQRRYDVPARAAMLEIDAAVARLKAQGATAIFIGGHSMGASAALAYAARHPGLAGVLAVAPGHDPSLPAFANRIAEDVQQARTLVAQGRGAEVVRFNDFNNGRSASFPVPAAIYLSYFDPAGLFVIPENAKHLSAPLLWVSGSSDPLTRLGRDYAFARAPADPRSRFIEVPADHLGTPDAAAGQIVDWVRGLTR